MPHRIISDLESRSSSTPFTPTSNPSAKPVAPPQATSHTGLCPPKGPCPSSAISAWTVAADLHSLPALPSPGPGETKTYKVTPLLKTLQWLPIPLRIRPHTNSDPQDALLSSCPAFFHCPFLPSYCSKNTAGLGCLPRSPHSTWVPMQGVLQAFSRPSWLKCPSPDPLLKCTSSA